MAMAMTMAGYGCSSSNNTLSSSAAEALATGTSEYGDGHDYGGILNEFSTSLKSLKSRRDSLHSKLSVVLLTKVIAINGKFPRPVINVTTNNNVEVNVRNKLDEDLLITWAGIQHRRSSWQDGVLGTNCPIQAQSGIGLMNFKPRIKLADLCCSLSWRCY